MSGEPEIRIVEGPEELARAAADLFATSAQRATRNRGRFATALSGGSTPKAMFAELASLPMSGLIDWTRCDIFFSDERFVPPESEESNFHTARAELLSKVAVPQERIHAVPTVGVSPPEAASTYEQTVREIVPAGEQGIPRFDLIFLGLGPDGHTASLFPDTEGLGVRDALVAANHVPRLDAWRITFTYPLLNAADTIAFLVQGADKAERVSEVLARTRDLPASRVQPVDGTLLWLLDRAAASTYSRVTRGAGPPRGPST